MLRNLLTVVALTIMSFVFDCGLLAPSALAQATVSNPSNDFAAPGDLDPQLKRQALEAYVKIIQQDNEALLQHRIALMKHDEAIYEWQRSASTVLLWVVVAVVAAGLCFSGYQLVVVMELARRRAVRELRTGRAPAPAAPDAGTPAAPVPAPAPDMSSQVGISAQGLQVTSSVVGVTVLVISIAFLYLFVREVYTIKPLTAPSADTRPAPPAADK
jgi:hypothetical protein